MAKMTVVFESGDRGLICRSPEDRGAWVIPGRSEKHATTPVAGHILAVEIAGTSANGKLRFARVVEDISATQEAALENIKRSAANAATFDELKGQKWGAISVASYISPWSYDVKTCLDVEGRPAVESVKVTSFLRAEYSRVENAGVFSPEIKLECPLPLGPTEAQTMLAYWIVALATPGYVSKKSPEWAVEFVTKVGELAQSVRQLEQRTGKQWFSRQVQQYGSDKDWPVMLWLTAEAKRLGVHNLREMIAKVELPLDKVRAELAELTTDRPTHVRFTDGEERAIKWSGKYGSVWVSKETFPTLVLDCTDERVAAIKSAGHSLQLETSWKEWTAGDRHNDFDSHYASDRRQLV